ncbi:VWA domain-containing protein [Flammeovirga pectinis]|uniref:VWA domain-containing protein n=1 Tax=Flammeovirga pectinis TaxID=2494373 RepID=A0A3Q9FQZ7_9BACT|nr:vWA domain-containing protein [Flammeovirga pectinis]AZQ64018.1 VWA domain-containing protein [Flammeovirga pectinis]
MQKVKETITKTCISTDYLLILDRSGSMDSCWKATIDGLNEQISTIKRLNQDNKEQQYTISLLVFDDEIEWVVFRKKPSKVQKFTGNEFPPRGLTALHDAIGFGIKKLNKSLKTTTTNSLQFPVVVIMTDGGENASKEYTITQINKKINALKEKKWSITFIGANQDVLETAKKLGVSKEMAHSFTSDSDGVHIINESLSKSMCKRAAHIRTASESEAIIEMDFKLEIEG